jgi:protease I
MDVLMVIAPQGFRDEEFSIPYEALVDAGHHVTVASTRVGECSGVHGAKAAAELALHEVRVEDFDGAVFVGGPGMRDLFNNAAAHRIIRALTAVQKVVAAICIAPAILARAGVLSGRLATVFPSEEQVLSDSGARLRSAGVVEDGRLITASGPEHARSFAEHIVSALKAQASAQKPRPRNE